MQQRIVSLATIILIFGVMGCSHHTDPAPTTVTSQPTFPPGHTQTETPTTAAPNPTFWVNPPTSSGIGKG